MGGAGLCGQLGGRVLLRQAQDRLCARGRACRLDRRIRGTVEKCDKLLHFFGAGSGKTRRKAGAERRPFCLKAMQGRATHRFNARHLSFPRSAWERIRRRSRAACHRHLIKRLGGNRDAERPGRHSHAERWNDKNVLDGDGARRYLPGYELQVLESKWQRCPPICCIIYTSAYKRNGASRALIPPAMASTQAWGYLRGPVKTQQVLKKPRLRGFFLCRDFDGLVVQRVEQDDGEADGLLLWPVARVLRVAHIGALHVEVHHAFLRRP